MKTFFSLLCLISSQTLLAQDNAATPIRQWHTKTLSFQGPTTTEAASQNPFTEHRLLVTFEHPEVKYTIRGFYAADGNASETSADAGGIWQVRFSADRPGKWSYNASLRHGKDIAISDDPEAGTTVEITDADGSFTVDPIAAQGLHRTAIVDFRERGKIVADKGYFRFTGSGPYWLKVGTDSPENLLAYADFDGTRRLSTETTSGEAVATEALHQYQPHVQDWHENDPTWKSGKGKGLIGAINYLSSTGMNASYFLTLNIGGDGKDVWPYAAPNDFTRFDCSKLDQWEIVFQHMQRRGVLIHLVTQETENERMLDDGDTGRLRKLYYRELIARFAHHPALIWNLGEENGPADFSPSGQTAVQQKAMATYIRQSDPYKHPIVIHTHSTPSEKDEILTALLGHTPIDGLSFQVDHPNSAHDEILRWRKMARDAGRPWLICMDEIGPWHTGVVPDAVDPDHDSLRRDVLWGSLLAGAAGVEWYFGAKQPHNDLTSEDWRQRSNMWKQSRHALDFFEAHLPYWEMQPAGHSTNAPGARCLAKPGELYAIYLPQSALNATQNIELGLGPNPGPFNVRWYDPIAGGTLQEGSLSAVSGTGRVDLGAPPQDNSNHDWVVLVSK